MCRVAAAAIEAAATPGAGVDDLVAAVALSLGAVAGAWLVIGALLVALSSTVRTVGRASAALDRAARAVAPRTLRRLLSAGVAAGLGLGLAGPAMAEAPPDLGWQVTEPTGTGLPQSATTQALRPPTPTPAPSSSAPGSATPAAAPVASPAEIGASVEPGSAPAAATPAVAAPADGSPTPDVAASPAPLGATNGPVTPALAPSPSAAGSADPTAADAGPTGTPSRAPAAPGPGGVSPGPGADADNRGGVVVGAGDTLWGIAAAHLGPAATDAEIAAAWPLWYEANRQVVGPDPDLLQPGQQLTVPTGLER